METKSFTAAKFTSIARGWSEREYKDVDAFMRRRADLVKYWGPRLSPGDRILELGCGDGALSCLLAAQGFAVTGVDISEGMIEQAKARAARLGVRPQFETADTDCFNLSEPFDAVVSFMSAFFTYVEAPDAFLRRVAPLVRKKVIVDWNFRTPGSFVEAADSLRRAGLTGIEWRPWLIPHTTDRPSGAGLRSWVEDRATPALLVLILKHWRYTVQLKGERLNGSTNSNGNGQGAQIRGNALPGTALQRALIRIGQVTR
jgi:SAM-dependent methyltransferase